MVRCPDELELERLLEGSTSAEEGLRLERHVQTCATCRAWLAEARLDEALVPHLRGTAAAGEPAYVPQHYRIVRRLGGGGMGVVFEAEQLRPRRRVALKVLRGAPAPRAVRRFEVEAEALAALEHEGIARVFEAGTFEGPQGPLPFFAMELVDGRPLDQHLREARPGLRARLELFLRIADAVAHAHRKGVVHRDLKPANVLVTRDGRPKVVDFGVARFGVADGTTLAGEVVGTLACMSPEQAAGDPARVDTRTDVYALGVLLYRMLTGEAPLDLRGLGFGEALRAIQEAEPVPPRARAPGLPRDLETIALKALRKQPGERYGSVDELAADVRRHLRHEPIAARPAGAFERMAKLARRNRLLFGSAAVLVAALAVGLAATTQQARRARAAERDALRQLERSGAAVDFLRRLLWGPEAAAVERPAGYTLREALDEAAALLDGTPWRDPGLEAELRVTLGNAYGALALHAEALRHLERALALRVEHLGPDHLATAECRNSLAVLLGEMGRPLRAAALLDEVLAVYAAQLDPDDARVDVARVNRGASLLQAGAREPAERELERALARMDRPGAEPSAMRAVALASLARAKGDGDRREEALALLERSVAEYAAALGPEHPRTLLARVVLTERRALWSGSEADLEPLREATAALERHCGEDHPFVADARAALAQALLAGGELQEAQARAREALAAQRARLGAHPDVVRALALLARALAAAGDREGEAGALEEARVLCAALVEPTQACTIELELRLGEALLALERAVEASALLGALAQRGDVGPYAARLHVARANLATRLMDLGRLDEAEDHLRGAIAGLQADPATPPARLLVARSNLASVLTLQGELEEARALLETVLAEREAAGAPARSLAATRHNLARVLARLGEPARAEALARDALAAWTTALGEGHSATHAARRNLADVLTASGRAADARALLEEVLPRARQDLAGDPKRLGEVLQSHGEALRALGERSAAEAALREARALLAEVHPGEHPTLREVDASLALLADEAPR